MGLELPGEDFSDPPFQTQRSGQRKRGRPSEVDPEMLGRNVAELQFALEQNWGVVGWLLWQAETIPEVQAAFRSVVNPVCRLLEPFTGDRTLQTTAVELRKLRKRAVDARVRYRREYVMCRDAEEKCERAFQAWGAESDPVKRAQIQAIRQSLARDYDEADRLETNSRRECDSFEAELKEREAYFAQSEILNFIQSNRRQFTPLNIACAMAGLPLVTARVSCEQCAKHGIDPLPGMAFDVFRTIQRTLQEPIRDLGDSIDSLRKHLLSGSENELPHSAELCNNWYFLESAIRSAARDTRAPFGSLAFRVFAEYSRAITSHTLAEAVLAQAQRLLLNGEDLGLQRGPQWSKAANRSPTNNKRRTTSQSR